MSRIYRRIALLMGSWGLVGCISLPEASSGAVGCPPHEIEISDESSSYGSQTWTATCGGRRFFCSDQASFIGGNDVGGVIHDVKCAAEITSRSSLTSSEPASSPASKFVEAQLPRKAVGFKFGATVEESRVSCQVSGHGWSSDTRLYHCDGTPTEVGLPTVAHLGFCDGKLCDLTAIASLPSGSDGEAAFKTLWKSLRKQYGVPAIEDKVVPASCQRTFVGCVAAGDARWQAQWKWQSGERVVAKTLPKGGHAQLSVRYVFGEAERVNPAAPPQGVDGSAF